MPSYYIYLITSLPFLYFGAKPPLSLEEFFEACAGNIKDSDLVKIKEAIEGPDYRAGLDAPQILKKWGAFNLALRTELAHLRAARKKVDPSKYASPGIFIPSLTAHIAALAFRNRNIIEAEKALDLARWNFLDEALLGHYFDIDFLIAYALKLRMLTRWDKVNNADKEALLKESLSRD